MTDSLWGLIEINLANNGIDDEAVAELMGYAKKDVFLERVFLQGNDLEVGRLAHIFAMTGGSLPADARMLGSSGTVSKRSSTRSTPAVSKSCPSRTTNVSSLPLSPASSVLSTHSTSPSSTYQRVI